MIANTTRAFWRGFRRGWLDPRIWAWLSPALGLANLLAFTQDPSGWRWLALAVAVLLLIDTGWLWRERAAIYAIRRGSCTGRDLIVTAARLYEGPGWRP